MSAIYHTTILETFLYEWEKEPRSILYHMYTTEEPSEYDLNAFEAHVRALDVHQGRRKVNVTVQVRPAIQLESPSSWEVKASVDGVFSVLYRWIEGGPGFRDWESEWKAQIGPLVKIDPGMYETHEKLKYITDFELQQAKRIFHQLEQENRS